MTDHGSVEGLTGRIFNQSHRKEDINCASGKHSKWARKFMLLLMCRAGYPKLLASLPKRCVKVSKR